MTDLFFIDCYFLVTYNIFFFSFCILVLSFFLLNSLRYLSLPLFCNSLVVFGEDVHDGRRPTREGMSSDSLPGHVVVLLPEEARLMIVLEQIAQKVVAQRTIETGTSMAERGRRCG